MSLLELRAVYKKNIKELESQLLPESDVFGYLMNYKTIRNYLYNQRIRGYLNNLRKAYETLGLRIGEEVDPLWLEGLTELEKAIFVNRFTEKKNYPEIAAKYNLTVKEVKQIFRSSLRTVLKNLT